MIVPTLLQAVLKFSNTNKLFEFKNAFTQKDLSQIRNLSAFTHILDLISKCAAADWTEQN